MSAISLNGASLGNALNTLLTASDLQPGDDPSYELCKTIYSYHPLGAKLADFPIAMAQSKQRKISVPKGPQETLVEAFVSEWQKIGADRHIFNVARLARVYGVSSIALLTEQVPSSDPVDYDKLADLDIGFNVLDPLNTAGSLVLDQNPNSVDFQKVHGIAVSGQSYHRSRTVTLLNEDPIYIEYTTSAFGYVGRSVYQRALYQLKSFINTLITDDMISLKSGVLIAKLQQQSSAIDRMMASVAGQKREMVKEAQTGNVISISVDETVESLNLQNIDGAYGMARKNIIENIASAAGTPSKIILSETFAEGFGEGTEDAKHIAQYIDRIREWMQPAYEYFEKIVRYRAWNPDFYERIQNEFPEYKNIDYKTAFYDWTNSFAAEWPSLLEEPDSEKVKVAEVQLRAIIAMIEVLAPMIDPENKVEVLKWAADNFNALKIMFKTPLNLDFDSLMEFAQSQPPVQESPEKEPSAPRPFSDSLVQLSEAVSRLPSRRRNPINGDS